MDGAYLTPDTTIEENDDGLAWDNYDENWDNENFLKKCANGEDNIWNCDPDEVFQPVTPTGLNFLSKTPGIVRSPILHPLQSPTSHPEQDHDHDRHPLDELSQLADAIAMGVLENKHTRLSTEKKPRSTFKTFVKKVKRRAGKRR